ncbi:hypothetical protein F5883DRAFT_661747 [Diaporthe sp. PMI_573]|nr:hypothetical protein F5883DRAFT_661747 [Diaporthaceae sp. PMI_573]
MKHFPATADPHDVLQYITADGAVVIEGAATRGSIDTILEELGNVQGGRTFGLAAKSQTFATQLLVNPLYIDLVKRVLTSTSIIYYEQERTVSTSHPQVSHTCVLTAEPGSAPWGLRRQDECHHISHPAKREADFGIVYAATDVTKENGAIRVVIGSNNWKDDRDPTGEDEYLVELRKGDALLCLGSVYYGQLSNTTDQRSILLSAFSTPGYRRQEENQYLAIPWEIAEKYPTPVQKFLGYSVSRPYGGSVEHMEPLEYFKVKGDWSKYIPVDLI